MLSQRTTHHRGLVIDKPASPTLSLEALHLLAQRRANERKETNPSNKNKSKGEVLEDKSLKVRPKKRKRQYIIDNLDNTDKDEINVTEPHEQSPLETSVVNKALKKTKLKEDCGALNISSITSTGKQKGNLRKLKKLKATSNFESLSMPPPSVTAPSFSSEESGDSDVGSSNESETAANAEMVVATSELPIDHVPETQAKNDTLNNSVETELSDDPKHQSDELGLKPLTHQQHHSQTYIGKPLVQRKLPSWIHHSEIIEEDIKMCSIPMSGFSLPNMVEKNLSKLGITQLFPVQVHVIPELLSSHHGPLLTGSGGSTPRDVCVCAPTGCGKTLCYVIPIVSALLNRVVCQVRAIIIVPSQELASQVEQVFKSVVRGTPLKTGLVSSQVPFEAECEMLVDRFSYPPSSCVDIIIATPGRLVEHITKSSFATLSSLRYLVVDEADKLLDQTFNQWLPKLLVAIAADKSVVTNHFSSQMLLEKTMIGLCGDVERLKLLQLIDFKDSSHQDPSSSHHSFVPVCCSASSQNSSPLQKLLFSATMSYNPEHLAALNLHMPKLFTVGGAFLSKDTDTTYTLPQQLKEVVVKCSLREKPLALLHLVTLKVSEEVKDNRVLCFTNSKDSTHRLFLLLQSFAIVSVGEMSSSVSHGRRKEVLASFKKGKTQVLICSDQMARGMDVEEVTCVVNYEPPRKFQTYLHRAGRTARAGEMGVVYTLLSRDEVHAFYTMLRQVSNKYKLQEMSLASDDLRPFKEQYPAALKMLKSKFT